MKKIKDLYKYLIGIVIGIIIVGSISVYAVTAVIESREVSYDNKESHGRSENVQGSIDELYERSGIMKTKWVDPILNGADPVFDEKGELIPVEIDGNGNVKYANLYTEWYKYEEKRWANAVILTDDGKKKNYETGDKIDEEYIESYFVWIPRYKYKIWNLGNYTNAYNFSDLKDSVDLAKNEDDTAARRITENTRLIDIAFGDTTKIKKMEEKEAKLNEYYTHPAFTLGEKELNGIWIGKFEVTGSINNISVKPGLESMRGQTIGSSWKSLYSYRKGSENHNSNLDPHMIKNIEWGAVTYLSHSVYGIGTEVNINNNSEYKTGYSAAANTDQSTSPGIDGIEDSITQPWNTSTGYLASTTGNITGVYDMNGGTLEYTAAYVDNYGVTSSKEINSGLNANDLTTFAKYFDKYSDSSNQTSYNLRILGDATGEMGPFYNYYDKDGIKRYHNAWYADYSDFVETKWPWFGRGGYYPNGVLAGEYSFTHYDGSINYAIGSRIILSVN